MASRYKGEHEDDDDDEEGSSNICIVVEIIRALLVYMSYQLLMFQ